MNHTSISIVKAIINDIHDTITLKEISKVKGWQFNEQTKKLLRDGFIKKEGNIIKLQENAKTILLQKISQTWNLENLLQDSNEIVFSYLVESLTVNEIMRNTGLSIATVYRAISDLQAIGIIQKETDTNGFYRGKITERMHIDPSKTNLIDFAKILKTEREKMCEPNAKVIYIDKEKTLKKVTKGKITKGVLTSFSVFTNNGIQYESPYDYYVEQKDPLDIHDIVIHSVLTSYKDNDKMGLIISIILYVNNKNKIDTRRLREIATCFGIHSVWLDIEAYIRGQKLKDGSMFLPWSEFVSKAKLYEIDSKKYTIPPATPLLFKDIGNNLDYPMTIFLMGGENMRLKKLKAVTNDCDVIVETSSDFDILYKVLTEHLGYEKIIKTEYSQEDLRIHPNEILTCPNKSRIDLFTKRVMMDLSLSDVMIKTADYIEYGKLKVGVLRNEYVFLLKAIASREGDIQDMAKLSKGSLNQPREFEHEKFDWDEVWREIIHQEKMNPIPELTVSIFEQISLFAKQTGLVPPMLGKLEKHVIKQLILRAIRGGRQPLKKIISMLIGGDFSEQMIRNRIDALVKDGTIRKCTMEKKVFVTIVHMPHFPYKDWKITPEKVEIYFDWRFPTRGKSTLLTIKKFVDDVIALGYNFIGYVDDIIIQQIDQFLDYEHYQFPNKDHKSVNVARACIGFSAPKLGRNNSSDFYILNYEKFLKTENKI